jgi:chemotaxis signal transduction protein
MTPAARAMEKGIRGPVAREGKDLIFALGKEEYGIGMPRVKEIIGRMFIRN